MCPGLRLDVSYTSYDGDDFGTVTGALRIPSFEGAIPISGLPALPLSFHPSALSVTKRLIQRGRKWESLSGQNFKDYSGVAIDTQTNGRYNITSRIMIDCATFHRIEADQAFEVRPFPNSNSGKRLQQLSLEAFGAAAQMNNTHEKLTAEQCLLATHLVRGFSFTEKLFLDFMVDNISDIDWNEECFEQLVLPASQKELVQALVAEHTQRTSGVNGAHFDDIVKGKGKGLILVLHGPPGVGKTLTAECVAEFSRRPLYIVSSGDLGTDPSTLDSRLSRILDLASTWKAVLLIDEADVFLERRSLNDMQRNGLVSIFLRTLEYYTGILFMTTNRVRTFDDAFKSRIHVPLKYDDLPHSSRVKIWQNFLKNVDGEVNVSEDGISRLAEGKLNGRQIKNVVRTAKSLASHKKRQLDEAGLKQVMDIQMEFEEVMNSVSANTVNK